MSDIYIVDLIADYLSRYSIYYPEIEDWYKKVKLEALSGRRSIIVCIEHGCIQGLAITKNKEHAKLCHISVTEKNRQNGLGFSLMRAAVHEMLSSGAHTVHVTAGEEVSSEYGDFFKRCGFQLSEFQKNRYRKGVDELVWMANREVLEACLEVPTTGAQSRPQVSKVPSGIIRVGKGEKYTKQIRL